MNPLRKFWFVLIGSVLALTIIACSCGSLIPTPTPEPPSIPVEQPTLEQATTVQEPSPSLAGYWMDPENNDVHTIEWQGDKYVVTNSASASDTLSITSQSWSDGKLTWTYHVESTGTSVTFIASSASSDSLFTEWSNTDGKSGTETLERVTSPVPLLPGPTQDTTGASMAGNWNDPDTSGTVTTIIAVDGGGYAVQSVINPNRGGNELTDQNWSNGVLTWTYCIPNGNCITSVTTSVSADTLYTTWTDDQGRSGQTDFQRLP